MVLTSVTCPAPTRADAQRIRDGLWAHTPDDLGIEHIHARAGSGHIDVILFIRSAAHGGICDERAALSAIGNLPLLHDWRVILADKRDNGKNAS